MNRAYELAGTFARRISRSSPSSLGMKDSEIIARFRATRDDEVFEELVNRYKARVFGLVLSILGPEFVADAEDTAQDVFIQVYRQLAGFRGESRFGTWLYSIARHKAIDRKRQARFRLPHVTQDEIEAFSTSGQRERPDGVLAKSERRKIVRDCIEMLPHPYQSILYLYYWMEYSVSEIAQFLDMRSGSVTSYLHRGRKMLYRHLQRRGVTHDF